MVEPESPAEREPTEYSLFRQKAAVASTERYGSPIGQLGVRSHIAVAVVIGVIGASIAFMLLASFPRKERVSGSLTPTRGLLAISSQKPGVVTEVHYEEGDRVANGVAIAAVSTDLTLDDGQSVGGALASSAELSIAIARDKTDATLASLDSQTLRVREGITGAAAQALTLRAQRALLQEQLKIAQATLEDLGVLRRDLLVSELQYRDAQSKAIGARQSMLELDGQLIKLDQESRQLRQELHRLSAERATNQALFRAESVAGEEKRLNAKAGTGLTLTAHAAGRITSLSIKPGTVVAAGVPVGTLMPDTSVLQAELWVPSSAIGFVQEGAEVNVMYDAFPYEKFGISKAVVTRVARAATPPENLPSDLQAKESMYRVVAQLRRQDVRAAGRTLPLAPGMKLSGDLILERRSLFEWMMQPLLAARERQS